MTRERFFRGQRLLKDSNTLRRMIALVLVIVIASLSAFATLRYESPLGSNELNSSFVQPSEVPLTKAETGADRALPGAPPRAIPEAFSCFVQNNGQAREGVLFYHQGTPSIALTDEGILIVLTNKARGHAVLLRFEGADLGAPQAGGFGCGPSNYFLRDNGAWQSRVPSYREILYDNLYDGVDLLLRIQNGLKADFLVHPGADPEVIRLQYKGANLKLDVGENLRLSTTAGELIDSAPYAYQDTNHGRKSIAVSYRLVDDTVRFAVGEYDPSRVLVIDPLLYSTYLGSGLSEIVNALEVDSSGNAYVTGTTSSVDFPTTPGAFDSSYGGRGDAFAVKLSADGTELLYATYLGGSDSDSPLGLSVDAQGNVHIAGNTVSSDFPTTAGAFDVTQAGLTDVFVVKIDQNGTELVYSTFLGGENGESATSIHLANSGNVFVAGVTSSIDFPTTSDAYDRTHNGDRDAFIAKLDSDGAQLLYSTFVGGEDADVAFDLDFDELGNILFTGWTVSEDFPTTPGAFDRDFTARGAFTEAFAAKLSSDGTDLLYATYLGGRSSDVAYAIDVDDGGNAYITGTTGSEDFPTTSGALGQAINGHNDVFVAKLNRDGTELLYATYIGGSGSDRGRDITVDSSGHAYVVGQRSQDFPTTSGAFDVTQGFAFVLKLSLEIESVPPPPAGTALSLWNQLTLEEVNVAPEDEVPRSCRRDGKDVPCFSVQQNLWLYNTNGELVLWAQNVVQLAELREDQYSATYAFHVWDSSGNVILCVPGYNLLGRCLIPFAAHYTNPVQLPQSFTFYAVVSSVGSAHTLYMVNDYGQLILDMPDWVECPCSIGAIRQFTDTSQYLPWGYAPSELVAVGASGNAEAIFEMPTRGVIEPARVRTLDGTWHEAPVNVLTCGRLPAEDCPKQPATSERSRHLTWDGNEITWSQGAFDQGVYISHIQGELSQPPPIPRPPAEDILYVLLDPPEARAHLTVFDDQGRATGYDSELGEFTENIPTSSFVSLADEEYVIIQNPSGKYRITVTALSSGDYHVLLSRITDNVSAEPPVRWVNGTVNQGESVQFSIDADTLDVTTGEGNGVTDLLTLVSLVVGVALVVGISAIVLLRRRRR